jgi:hypothetical protein
MVVLGLVLGGAATAFAALLVGDDGYVFGWSVVKDNEEICSDPGMAETKSSAIES